MLLPNVGSSQGKRNYGIIDNSNCQNERRNKGGFNFGMGMAGIWRSVSILAAILVLVAASVWSIRAAMADHLRRQPSLDAIAAACKLNPFDYQAWIAKAQYEEQAGIDASATWRRAASLDPRNPRILIPAGISAELREQTQEAENYYRTAEQYNALWLPRWTLANYYFRQGRMSETIEWLKKALDRSYGDLSAAFDLAKQAGASEERILRQILPPSRHAYAGFLYWLSREQLDERLAALIEDSASTYVKLVSNEGFTRYAEDPVLYASNRLVQEGLGSPARRIWRAACGSNIIDCSKPIDDGLIGNGEFSKKFIVSFLDWTLLKVPGITSIHQPGTGTVKYIFSGDQPEQCDLLQQWIVPSSGEKWRVRFDFQTRDISQRDAAGLQWELDGKPLSTDKAIASDTWRKEQFDIEANPIARTSRLALVYRRASGTTRLAGELWIRNVRADRNSE